MYTCWSRSRHVPRLIQPHTSTSFPPVRYSTHGTGKVFYFLQNVHTSPETHIASCSMGSFPGVKLPGREVHHLSPSFAEVKNEWSNSSAHHVCLHSVDRESFTVHVYLCSNTCSNTPRTACCLRTRVAKCVKLTVRFSNVYCKP